MSQYRKVDKPQHSRHISVIIEKLEHVGNGIDIALVPVLDKDAPTVMTEISQKYPRHRHCSTYDTALRAVLSRYLSAITVETILSGVYDDENLDPSKMT